jgi:hypothetical protein
LNRRVPNGTHGGVRGRNFLNQRKFLLLDPRIQRGGVLVANDKPLSMEEQVINMKKWRRFVFQNICFEKIVETKGQ